MIDHLETPGGGLTLRPWKDSDLEAVLVAFESGDMAGQAAEPIDTVDAARRWLRGREEEWLAGSGYNWAVTDGGVVVGNVAVTAINRRHDTGWVSYWTSRWARGRGAAGAGLRAVAATGNASMSSCTPASSITDGWEAMHLKLGRERYLSSHSLKIVDAYGSTPYFLEWIV